MCSVLWAHAWIKWHTTCPVHFIGVLLTRGGAVVCSYHGHNSRPLHFQDTSGHLIHPTDVVFHTLSFSCPLVGHAVLPYEKTKAARVPLACFAEPLMGLHPSFLFATANQAGGGGSGGQTNNQAAQGIIQGLGGGDINQGQDGKKYTDELTMPM
jgi:hypothetical protein